MELFELFGKIVIGGADDANRKIDSVADNAEIKAAKICNAFGKIGSLKYGLNSNITLPDIKTLNYNQGNNGISDGISALIDGIKNTSKVLGEKQSSSTRKIYNEKIHHIKKSESIHIRKNIIEEDYSLKDSFIKMISDMAKNTKYIPMRADRKNVVMAQEKASMGADRENYKITVGQNDIQHNGQLAAYLNNIKTIIDKVGRKFEKLNAAENNYIENSCQNRNTFAKEINKSIDDMFDTLDKTCKSSVAEIYRNSRNSMKKMINSVSECTLKMSAGIRSAKSSIVNACSEIAAGASNRLRFDGAESGSFAMETYRGGILQKAGEVYSSVAEIASNVSKIMSSISIPDISADVKVNAPDMPKYAKGGIVTREHIARVGEDGAEAIIPLERNTQWIDKVASRMSGNVSNAEVVSKLDELISLVKSQGIYLDSGQLVGALAGKMDRKLGSMARLKKRGV